jgi:hypothetical protein
MASKLKAKVERRMPSSELAIFDALANLILADRGEDAAILTHAVELSVLMSDIAGWFHTRLLGTKGLTPRRSHVKS